MAKESKAEANVRLEAENVMNWNNLRSTWYRRVLEAVLLAVEYSHEFKVTKTDDTVRFECQDDEYTYAIGFYGTTVLLELPEEPNWLKLYDLESFEEAVRDHKAVVQAAVDLAARRTAAMNKLTAEDRRLLGLGA